MDYGKVISIDSYLLPPRWIVVRVETADGYVGWGEAGVISWPATVKSAIGEIASLIVGESTGGPSDVWAIATKGRGYGGGAALMSAASAIDQALWDIAGRRAGMPIYQLLGGLVRDRVRAYAWLTLDDHGRDVVTIDEIAKLAVERVAMGFTAVKTGYPRSADKALEPIETLAKTRDLVDQVAAIRDAVGPQIGLALDIHSRCSVAMTKLLLPMLEPFGLMWIEEPIAPPHIGVTREVAGHTGVQLATGERYHAAPDFNALIDAGMSILQPDLNNVGGITQARRIADVARAHNVAIAPHCSAGPIGLAVSLQFNFATHNCVIQEQGLEYYADRQFFPTGYLDYIREPHALRLDQGYFLPSNTPGIGVEIDEEALLAVARDENYWRPPAVRRTDGSVAEW